VSIAVENRFREVEKLVLASQVRNLDPEVAACYCKLACIMVCGAIERSVESLITDRVGNRSVPQVKSFLKAFFQRGTNYDCEQIMSLLYRFDTDWGHTFREFVEKNERIKTAVSSCYAVRNSIAHGGGQSLGPAALRQYFDDAFNLIVQLEQTLRA
jgi:RiboL-PSP-HEPN